MQGLFGYTDGAAISNLGVTDVEISGNWSVGGLVGFNNNDSSITNCYSTGSVMGNSGIGGLVGSNEQSSISNSYSTGSVTGSGDYVGGLVGLNENESSISNSYSIGSVIGDSDVGGLLGSNNESYISNCYSTDSVTGNYHVGGLVGKNDNSSIYNSYSTGSVAGDSSVGGLVGHNYESFINNSYSNGSATGDSDVGGLVGANSSSPITNSYSTGSVIGNDYVGGLVGYCEVTTTATACFWDMDTSGMSTSAGGAGKTTAEMLDITTYTAAGWDFMDETINGTEDIWDIDLDWNDGYPFLYDTLVGIEEETNDQIPEPTHLIGNYPNPFNPTTTISFNVKNRETARLEIFNIKGQLVKQYPAFTAGSHKIEWHGKNNNGKSVGSGVYFYRLSSGISKQTRKMLLLK
ncbi:MAG: GLUG motif-containing protein [Candidatus Zophobacter franzmannii]|nr:GLUG motif-containing protein [Candidatus Zophobacter franzmannii]